MPAREWAAPGTTRPNGRSALAIPTFRTRASAWETYGARYFELYTVDLDAAVTDRPDWLAELRQVQAGLCER